MQYNTIHVEASRSYDIHIGRGILAGLGEFIRPLLGNCRLAVLTDSNVDALYGNAIMEYLNAAGYNACKYVIPAGEASKCADTLLAFLNFMAARSAMVDGVTVQALSKRRLPGKQRHSGRK